MQTAAATTASNVMPVPSFTSNMGTSKVPRPTFNLDPVKQRVHVENPELTREAIEEAAERYVQYWMKIKETGGEIDVPDHEVDLIWHGHILFTKQYDHDTKEYFGHFLHHEPKMLDLGKCCNTGECNCSIVKTVHRNVGTCCDTGGCNCGDG